jgi:hypothetical protein
MTAHLGTLALYLCHGQYMKARINDVTAMNEMPTRLQQCRDPPLKAALHAVSCVQFLQQCTLKDGIQAR